VQAPAAAPAFTVVLDPGHGGTDPGARGASGVIEKDVTLVLAKIVQQQLEHQGFRVVFTRQSDENPSFDDRAATANAEHNAVFISLHVASMGATGTATAFSLPATGAPKSGAEAAPEAAGGLVRWRDAQQKYLAQSRKLAEFIQVQLGQKLRGSPEVPLSAPVRQLRSVTAPAVAVELASVAVADRKPLDAAAAALAEAITRGVAAFKTTHESGAN
jgi:N-acetylmuramoyl-L-alanine amidase